MSNVIVITREVVNLGVGADCRIVFTDAKYHIDNDKWLHVQHDARVTAHGGNLASFPPDQYLFVLRSFGNVGKLVDENDVQVGTQFTVVPTEFQS